MGATWAASWGQVTVLGAFWAHLGAVLGRLGRQVGAKWPSWARLEAVLGGLGRDFGAKMGPKIDQKTDQKLEATSRSIFDAARKLLGAKLSDFGPFWAPWIFKNHRFSLCKTHFFEICWKTFWKATFSTKRRSKRPKCGPRWAADAESARPGEDLEELEGVDRDFGQRLWAETLDRDFGQRL